MILLMSCLYVFQVLGFHLVADLCAGLQFPVKIFKLLCAENGPLFLYKICEPILQLEHMKDNPVFTLNRNALQGASVTENDGRKNGEIVYVELCAGIILFKEMLQSPNVSGVLLNGVVEGVLDAGVHALVPTFVVDTSRNFAGDILAFQNIDSSLMQEQRIYFGGTAAAGNVQIFHQHELAAVLTANACYGLGENCFAIDSVRVVF